MFEYGDDPVTAYAWLIIAGANGNDEARAIKVEVAKEMTADQKTEAQKLAREWVKENPKFLQE